MHRRSESDQRCRIQRRAAECAECGSSAAVWDLVSGFVRFQSQRAIAGHECQRQRQRLLSSDRSLAHLAQSKAAQGPRAPQNQGRENGRQPGRGAPIAKTCSEKVLWRPKNPHESSTTASEAISIRWRPIFPSGPLPETSVDKPSDWSQQKLVESPACVGVQEGGDRGRATAPVHMFERTTVALRALLQNSATRAQLGTTQLDIGLAAARGARVGGRRSPRVRRAHAVAAPAAPSTAKLPERARPDPPRHFARRKTRPPRRP